MANFNELYPTGQAVASPVIDYDLRNLTSKVVQLKLDKTLVYNASAGSLPVLTGAGLLNFTTPQGIVEIPVADIFGGAIYQTVSAVAGVFQILLDTTACNPGGNDLAVSIERWNDNDALPREQPFYVSFDPSCTYTDAQRLAAIVAQINASTPKYATAAIIGGNTGITVTSDTAGDQLIVTAGAGFLNATNTTVARSAFGTGASLLDDFGGFKAEQVVRATSYRIIELRYWQRIRAAGHGFAPGQTDQNNAEVLVKKKAWIAFDSASTQDTNFNAATAIIFPTEVRFRKVASLTPVN